MSKLSKLHGVISFICLLAAPGAVESEMYITGIVLIVIFAIFAYLSIREDGGFHKTS